MRWTFHRPRLSALAALCICPLLSGCFVGGYVYPTLQYVPRTRLAPPVTDDIHAFRVDIVDYRGSVEFASVDDYYFRELPVDSRGSVAAQTSARLGRGWWAFWVAHGYRQRLHPTVRVRLYRPGFETIEVGPWEWKDALVWRPANSLQAQEKAIDELIATRATNALYKINPEAWRHNVVDYALAAPTNDAERNALEFVVAEYQRLSAIALVHGNTAAASQLMDKARQIDAASKQEANPVDEAEKAKGWRWWRKQKKDAEKSASGEP